MVCNSASSSKAKFLGASKNEIWWKVFLWAATCNAVIYGIATIVAFVNLRAHKSARLYLPVLMIVMGTLSTFTVLLVSCLIIAAIFDTMDFPFNELYAFACGFLPVLILFIFSGASGVCRWLAVVSVGLLLAYFYVSPEWVSTYPEDNPTFYGVIFDAGSMGTRARVYTFLRNVSEKCKYRLVHEVAFTAEPGLSDFAKFPLEAAEHLRPLLEDVKRSVPRSMWSETPLVLRATAGLRLLPERTANALLESVYSLFKTSGFQQPREGAIGILDGVDEGLFAWISLVFLYDDACLGRRHGSTAPLAIFDLGGASFQLTFLVNSGDDASLSDEQLIRELPSVYHGTQFAPSNMKLYAHSYLGLGLTTAVHSMMLGSSNRNTTLPHALTSPCLPQNVTANWTHAGVNWTVTSGDLNLLPHQVFDACYASATRLLAEHGLGVRGGQPEALKHQEVRAMSFMCTKTDEAEKMFPRPPNGRVPVQWYFDVAKRYCASPNNDQPFGCIEMTYVSAVLSFGLGLPTEKQLDLNRTSNGIEVGWPVGYLVDMLIRDL